MKNTFKKGFLKSQPYRVDEKDRVVFGLYYDDGSTLGEVSMIWKDALNEVDYELVIPNDSWRVVIESQDLFRLLHKYDNGKLTPDIFYELLNKAGYELL